jgi:hypothetical protein
LNGGLASLRFFGAPVTSDLSKASGVQAVGLGRKKKGGGGRVLQRRKGSEVTSLIVSGQIDEVMSFLVSGHDRWKCRTNQSLKEVLPREL